jgi:hypothetical protein
MGFVLIRQKKTLYEVLELRSDASLAEISAAYQSLCDKLKHKQEIIGIDETEFQQKVIDLAYGTLSVSMSRDAYDAKLKFKDTPQEIDEPIKLKVAIDENKNSPLRRVLVVIAGVMVIWLSIQLIYMFIVYSNNGGVIQSPADAASQAEEKVRMQEYYQEHGVRAGSKIEADLLEVEQREKDSEARLKENEKKDQARKYKEFVDESHRVGEQVSNDLRLAEEATRYEAERKRQQEEQEIRKNQEMEQRRIDNERSKWRLSPSRTNSQYRNDD